MTLNYGKEKIKSANFYQLFSHLLNQEDGSYKTQSAVGMLLYPTIATDYNLNFKYNGHRIMIRTVNLNSNWRKIANRWNEIIKDWNRAGSECIATLNDKSLKLILKPVHWISSAINAPNFGCKVNCVKVKKSPTLIQYEQERRTIQFRRDQEKSPRTIPFG